MENTLFCGKYLKINNSTVKEYIFSMGSFRDIFSSGSDACIQARGRYVEHV